MRNDRGYTYLITNGREYKIGITTGTPVKRVAELQTGSPTKISISAYSYNSNALAMEIELHKKFATKRLEGEWFALDDNDVAIIHHHFETNHLDEYFAPFSEKGKSKKEPNELDDLLTQLATLRLSVSKLINPDYLNTLDDVLEDLVEYYSSIEAKEELMEDIRDTKHKQKQLKDEVRRKELDQELQEWRDKQRAREKESKRTDEFTS